LQTFNYDIFAKLSQLDICKPTHLPPYSLLITSLWETGGKMASTAAIRLRTFTSTWQWYIAAVKYPFAQAGNILLKINVLIASCLSKCPLFYAR